VRGRFVFNFPYNEATDKKIIRPLQFIGGPAVGTSAAIPAFVAVLKKGLTRILRTAESWTKTPKVIVRADDYESLRKVQDEIDNAFTHIASSCTSK
jgi:hypothetical protein